MSDRPIPPPHPRRPRTPRYGFEEFKKLGKRTLQLYLLLIVAGGIPLFLWFACRIEPGADQIAILIRKTGKDLPPGGIIALEKGQKGIQLDVLAEGRYFRNPYTWAWEIHKVEDIPAGKLGVLTGLYGKDLPQGKVIAEKGMKGIRADVKRPGKYRINPYAEHLELFNAMTIRPGFVGVMTSLVGDDVLNAEDTSALTNGFLVAEGDKGVVSKVLDPGTYYLNPYMINVSEVNLQSQRFEMSGDDVITFLTKDGFTITVEGTIEFAIQRKKAAQLTHRVGDMEDIVKKVILPRARGFSRIEGSKYPAINFIVGETRQEFQNILETHLREKSEDWGVDIKSVLVRKIIPPDEIASINREREVAVQDAAKYHQEIIRAKSKAELTKQEMLAIQNGEKVEAETLQIKAVIEAEKQQAVDLVSADKDLEVAEVQYAAAEFQAQAILLEAEGERDAIRVQNVADAEVLAQEVKAFGSGMDLSRYLLYQRIAPRIESVITDDGPEGLGSIFSPYLPRPQEKSVKAMPASVPPAPIEKKSPPKKAKPSTPEKKTSAEDPS